MRVAAAVVAATALVAGVWGILHVGWYGRGQIVDYGVYQQYGDAIKGGAVPYRDFQIEYPPAALPVFALPSFLSRFDYTHVFQVEMAISLVAIVLAVFVLAGPEAALLAGLAPLALGSVVISRFDLWPAALAIWALVMLVSRRFTLRAILPRTAFAAQRAPPRSRLRGEALARGPRPVLHRVAFPQPRPPRGSRVDCGHGARRGGVVPAVHGARSERRRSLVPRAVRAAPADREPRRCDPARSARRVRDDTWQSRLVRLAEPRGVRHASGRDPDLGCRRDRGPRRVVSLRAQRRSRDDARRLLRGRRRDGHRFRESFLAPVPDVVDPVRSLRTHAASDRGNPALLCDIDPHPVVVSTSLLGSRARVLPPPGAGARASRSRRGCACGRPRVAEPLTARGAR